MHKPFPLDSTQGLASSMAVFESAIPIADVAPYTAPPLSPPPAFSNPGMSLKGVEGPL